MSPTFDLLYLVNVESLQSNSGRPRMLKLCSFYQMTGGTSLYTLFQLTLAPSLVTSPALEPKDLTFNLCAYLK